MRQVQWSSAEWRTTSIVLTTTPAHFPRTSHTCRSDVLMCTGAAAPILRSRRGPGSPDSAARVHEKKRMFMPANGSRRGLSPPVTANLPQREIACTRERMLKQERERLLQRERESLSVRQRESLFERERQSLSETEKDGSSNRKKDGTASGEKDGSFNRGREFIQQEERESIQREEIKFVLKRGRTFVRKKGRERIPWRNSKPI